MRSCIMEKSTAGIKWRYEIERFSEKKCLQFVCTSARITIVFEQKNDLWIKDDTKGGISGIAIA